MRLRLAGCCLAVFSMSGATGARAVTTDNFPPKSTADLVALCSADKNDPLGTAALNYCHGFAEGAVSVQIEHEAASRLPRLFCMPKPQPTHDEAVAAFVAWANARPTHATEPPADGLFHFLADTYPCPKPMMKK